MARDPRPCALGCHIYSGAFTLGVSRVFNIVGQWEEGPWGAATFDLNFPKVPHYLTRDSWPVAQHVSKVNFLFVNPPCAIWSAAGSHLGTADPRIAFQATCIDLAKAIQPDVFVLESVPRAWSPTGGRDFYTRAAGELGALGYQVTIYLTNGLLAGGAQWRERFHFIAHRGELEIPEPTATIADAPTVRDLIGDLEHLAVFKGEGEPKLPNHTVRRPGEPYLNVLRNLKQGENWELGLERALAQSLPARKHRFLAHRLRYDAPAPTIADINSLFHPAQDRPLTLREGARLCGYPDSFVFALTGKASELHDAKSTDATQAVMPPMGEHLARLALRSLDAASAQPGELRIVDHRVLARAWSPGRYAATIAEAKQ